MRPNVAVVVTASMLLLVLTGCVADPVAATPTPTPLASPTPVPSGPLTCDDLAPADVVAAVLEGADGVPVEPVAAVRADHVFESIVLEGVGGLTCSWRIGSGMPEYNAPSDWAYLRVDVLPGAAQWHPLSIGGEPSPDTREVAGIEASVSGGDPGWAISAPVGDDWVLASISAAGLTGSGSRFNGLGGGAMIDRLVEVAASAFAVLQQADAAQLARPALEPRQGDAICNGGLDEQGIMAAMQVPAGSAVEYSATDATTYPPDQFIEFAYAAARTFNCELIVDRVPRVTITTARGYAPLFDRLLAPNADAAFVGVELADARVRVSSVDPWSDVEARRFGRHIGQADPQDRLDHSDGAVGEHLARVVLFIERLSFVERRDAADRHQFGGIGLVTARPVGLEFHREQRFG